MQRLFIFLFLLPLAAASGSASNLWIRKDRLPPIIMHRNPISKSENYNLVLSPKISDIKEKGVKYQQASQMINGRYNDLPDLSKFHLYSQMEKTRGSKNENRNKRYSQASAVVPGGLLRAQIPLPTLIALDWFLQILTAFVATAIALAVGMPIIQKIAFDVLVSLAFQRCRQI